MTTSGIESVVRGRRTAMLMALDAVALASAYFFGVVVRYDAVPDDIWRHAAVVSVAAIGLHWLFGMLGRVYLGRVGVATTEETLVLSSAGFAAGGIVFVANASVDPYWVARSLPVTATFLGLSVMLTARATWRRLTLRLAPVTAGEGLPALVVGAGESGARLVHSMRSHPEAGLAPVGFLDDDPWMRKRRHFGVPVLGAIGELERVVLATRATTVVVPTLPRQTWRTLFLP